MIEIKESITAITLIGILLVGCVNGNGEQNFKDLKGVTHGMKMGQVHAIMTNDPVRAGKAYWSDSLTVEEYESAFGASDYYKIIYSKTDSTVVDVQLGD